MLSPMITWLGLVAVPILSRNVLAQTPTQA
jgi:hypothetical protein